MDGTVKDLILMSAYPIEESLLQKDDIDNDNEKPTAAIERTLDSVGQCTQSGKNIDPDAGANAGSRAEITYTTNNPLSELVRSPHNGLSFICPDFYFNEKKPSLSWSSEPGNMVISSPANIKAWQSSSNASIVVGDSRLTQLAPNLDRENSNQETLVRSDTRTKDMMPPSEVKTCELYTRLHGDMEPLTTMNISAVEVNRDEHDQSTEKEMAVCSEPATDTQMNVDFGKETMVIASALQKKTSLPVPENGNYAAALSVKLEDAKVDLLPVETHCRDSDSGRGFTPFGRSGKFQSACLEDTLVSEASTVKQYHLHGSSMPIPIAPDRKNTETDLVIEENDRNKMGMNPKSIKIPCLDKVEAGGGSDCGYTGMIVAYHVEDEGKNSSAENAGASPMDKKYAPIEASPNKSQRKGKEKALSDAEVDRIISKGKDDSHESVESCNSRELFSKGKRAWNFEQPLIIGSKRIKKHHHETPHSASFLGHDSSFNNWISNIAKRFSKFYMNGEPSSAITSSSYRGNGSHGPPSSSLDKNQEDPRFSSVGFQNVIQTSYCPRRQIKYQKGGDPNDQESPNGLKELEVANMNPFAINPSGEPNKETVNFPSFIPILNQRPQVGVHPSIRPTITSASTNTILLEKPERIYGENHNSCKIACGLETGVIHSSKTSLHVDSGPLPEAKGSRQIDSVDPNTSSDLVTDKRKPLGSLWITRFSSKASGPVSDSTQFNQDTGASIERFTTCNSFFPRSQDIIFSVEDRNNLEVSHEPSAKDLMNAQSINIKNHSTSSAVSCGLRRMNTLTSEKLKPKLNPVITYQRFKDSDETFSSFTRLDALRHFAPSKVSHSAAHADTICYFCGIHGHTLKDCSWVIDSELKDLLKNINVHHRAEETSCLCIKCFEVSHWAIACPYISSRKKENIHSKTSSASYRNCGRIPLNPQNRTPLTKHDRNMLKSATMDGKHQLAGAYSGESSRAKTEVKPNIGSKLRNAMILNEWVLASKPIKRDLPRDDCHKGLPGKGISKEDLVIGKSTSTSFESASKEKQMPFHDHINRQIPDIPRGTFGAIQKLRLSRTDILKWSMSPVSNFSLEGYFLRLRLGKWEEGLGGTGYHMARISGASRGRPGVTCKFPISVDIGGLKCSVDRRFVSNHDFIEDELMAWWCATLRSDGRLPSEEDLSLKLAERERYGF